MGQSARPQSTTHESAMRMDEPGTHSMGVGSAQDLHTAERAKHLPVLVADRESDGHDLAVALKMSGTSHGDVARAWGTSEHATFVSKIQNGQATLSWAKIKKLPRGAKLALLTRELATLDDGAAPASGGIDRMMHTLTHAVGNLARVIVDCMADDRLDTCERPVVGRAAFAVERLSRTMRVWLSPDGGE